MNILFFVAVAGFICGAIATAGVMKVWKLTDELNRDRKQDLISRLTERRWSLMASEFNGVRKWHVCEGNACLATSAHWQRAAQIALNLYAAPPCENCKGQADAVAGETYATCKVCGRAVRAPFLQIIPDPLPPNWERGELNRHMDPPSWGKQ
jgi:hypothetical protein